MYTLTQQIDLPTYRKKQNKKGTGYLCKFCINKCNKRTRIDEEIRKKIPRLKTEGDDIIRDFKRISNVCESQTTPTKSKRPLTKTIPIARKTKTRLLTFSRTHAHPSTVTPLQNRLWAKSQEFRC